MSDSLRDFSTQPEPNPFITIDGERCELIMDLDTVQMLENRDMGEEFEALIEKRGEERSADDNIRIMEITKTLMGRIVTAPTDVIAKLNDMQKQAIMSLWNREITKRRDPTGTDGGQSPDSIGSTARTTG